MTRPVAPLSVFYRMQVVHERNQDNYFLFTRWGTIGSCSQFQTTPFESLEKAAAEFCKIFKSKAANDWFDRANFVHQTLKYRLHKLDYSSPSAVADVLEVSKWHRVPTKLTPLAFRRILNTGACPKLLAEALGRSQVDQPLGRLQKAPLDEARAMLKKIRALIPKVSAMQRLFFGEASSAETTADKVKAMANVLTEISVLSSRIFELVPVPGFQHTSVYPISNIPLWREWHAKIERTDDITLAARLLLGAQSQVRRMSPTDYVYRALDVRITPLASDSEELHLIERYVNRSAPGTCKLFAGPGAQPLPDTKAMSKAEREKAQRPRWQALQNIVCYNNEDLSDASLAGKALAAGSLFEEYARKGEAVCVKRPAESMPGLWLRTTSAEGDALAVQLTEREAASAVAAVYRLDRRGEGEGGPDGTLLFHGSGMVNSLSIISQGLQAKPPGVYHNGSAFGNGIYFANAFAKSRAYCSFHCGVGFILLCEVCPGRCFEGKEFRFQKDLHTAHLQAARKRLGLPPDAAPDEHEALRVASSTIHEQIQTGEIEDFTGTEYDSFHFQSGAAPDPTGDVTHPDGYRVPCGAVVQRPGGSKCGQGTAPKDEIVVYDAARVRRRYILELRDPAFVLTEVPRSDGAPAQQDDMHVDGGGGDGDDGEEVEGSDEDGDGDEHDE
uniref:Poly [ADP-ribose] polymerase n=1 Tax=Zooxanthella nutricula TaxID=1333877 RepID=A0A7S2I1B3_9DINO